MYTIDEKRFETAEDAARYIVDYVDLTDEYEETLDGCYEDITVCGYSFTPSEALRKLDESVYRCEYLDYVEVVYSNLVYDFDCMSDGDTFLIYDLEVVCAEEEQE